MSREDDFYRQVADAEKQQRKKARKEKWKKREDSFWKAFLFTEDGKPKSGLIIYTFFLSFVFIGLYIAGFALIIEGTTGLLSGLPAFWGNLLQSLAVGAVAALAGVLIHVLLKDKRLAFGAHLWLAFYLAAMVITLIIMLKGDAAAIRAMLEFALWFAVIPVAMGLVVTYLLYRRDYKPPVDKQEEPEWKKYIDHR